MAKLSIDSSALMPLRDAVYKALRNAILKGELKPGTRLMEIQLSTELGVSRTPVREAIRMLEREGLATTSPRRGARVMRMTIKDLEDVLEIRQALDNLAATSACDNITKEDINELEIELESFSNAISEGKVRPIVENDEKFHNTIYRIANNSRLTEIVITLREQMYRYRYEYIKEKCSLENLYKEHKYIVESLKAKDKERASEIMRTHIGNQYAAVKEMILSQE